MNKHEKEKLNHIIADPIIRITLMDPDTWDNFDLFFQLYDIPIANKWLKHFTDLTSGPHDYNDRSFKVSSYDRNKKFKQIKNVIKKINKFYDEKIPEPKTFLDSYGNVRLEEESLNTLHESYERYGERLQEKLAEDWWKDAWEKIPEDSPLAKSWPGTTFNEEINSAFHTLNSLIHTHEVSPIEKGFNTRGDMQISFNPRTHFLLEEADFYSMSPFLKFGDFCLGYNTLGKNLHHIVIDNDQDAVDRNAVTPQATWSNEVHVRLSPDNNLPFNIHWYSKQWHNLQINEKLGYKFGNFIENREGYIKIGELIWEQSESLYLPSIGILKDTFRKFNTIHSMTVISRDAYFNRPPFSGPDSRKPVWKKPKPVIGKKIEHILNPDTSVITWIINDVCTYSCRYCPPVLQNGKNHKYNWHHILPFLTHLFEFYSKNNNDRKIIFSLSGGEPTLSPFFSKLVREIHRNSHHVNLSTNLTRSEQFIERTFKHLTQVCASFHPAMVFPNKTEDEFISKLNTSFSLVPTTARIMLDPMYWEQTVEFIERIKEETLVNIDTVIIDEQYGGIGFKLCEIKYTDDQLEFINNFNNIRQHKGYHGDEKHPAKDIFIKYEDEDQKVFELSEDPIRKGETNFFNYKCHVGKESLFIDRNGQIKRANCHEGGFIGTLDHWQVIDWDALHRPIMCSSLSCLCGGDLMISKEEV